MSNTALSPADRQKALDLLKQRRSAASPAKATIPPAESSDGLYPATPSQVRLWFLDRLHGPSPVYHLPFAVRLSGDLDAARLRRAAHMLVDAHSALRTGIVETQSGPAQRVYPQATAEFATSDIVERQLEDALLEAGAKPFDLSQAPLIRFALLRLDDRTHILHIVVHHAVADGISLSILFEDLIRAYVALGGRGEPLSRAAVEFKDYAAWQAQRSHAQRSTETLDYWRETLSGAPELLELPTDRPRPSVFSHRGDHLRASLTAETSGRIRAFAQAAGSTPYLTMLTAFSVVLSRYSRMHDIVIGTPIANREAPGVERVVGFFANTLPLRMRIPMRADFSRLLDDARAVLAAAMKHQELPFDKMVEALAPERSQSYTPLFQVAFSFQKQAAAAPGLDGLALERCELPHRTSKFDLCLEVQEAEGVYNCDLEYATDLFDRETVERLFAHYVRAMEAMIARPNEPALALPILDDDEYRAVTVDWNGRRAEFDTACFPDAFDAQTMRTPDAVAVEMLDLRLTYRELRDRSNALAQWLVSQGIGLESRVALLLPREIDYLIAMIAVWKAGACFVPLNPESPIERSRAVVDQCRPALILSNDACRQEASAMGRDFPTVFLEEIAGALRVPERFANRAHPRGLAYVIYTSGSTGVPKGAMIEHEGMTNHLWLKIRDFSIGPEDSVAEIAVVTFDVSVWQYVAALLVGARTVVYRGDASWVPDRLLEETRRAKVTIMESVPSHTKIILDEMETRGDAHDVSSLRLFICNGEPLPAALCNRFFGAFPHCALVNAYGATECSDDSSHLHIVPPVVTELPYMPVSGILPNMTTYILDPFLNPVPVGVTGEVYIGGIGVGRGYFEDPRKTAGAFIPDPFCDRPGARLYRIGDLARYCADGAIEFIGRVDFQIKIRGLRVELNEIEKVLSEHPAISECVVTALKSGEDYRLVAYVVAQATATDEDVIAHCATTLPDYMIPSVILRLDAFPLTENGKVDRKALPVPELGRSDVAYAPPRDALETALCDIYAESLKIEQVGIDDSFFRIGGHSLLAIELNNRIRQRLGGDLGVRAIFECPTVRTLAERLRGVGSDARPDDAPVADLPVVASQSDTAPLAPSQVAVWYTYLLDRKSPVYNVNFCELFFRNLDVDRFIAAWQRIIDHHDAFRLRFRVVDGEPVQTLGPEIRLHREDVLVDRTDIGGDAMMREAERIGFEHGVAPFDLERGPLLRLKLVAYAGGVHQLIFTTHHIVWDETSTIRLMAELTAFYNEGERATAAPTMRYLDYAIWINRKLESGDSDADRRYWLELFSSVPQALDLPTDRPRPAIQRFEGASALRWIDAQATAAIRRFAASRNETMFMYLLATIEIYLARISGQEDFVVGCPIANRTRQEVSDTLGLFAAPLPIRSSVRFDSSVQDVFERVRERCLSAFEHQGYPCNRLIEALPLQRDLSRPKLFSVMYGLQNDKNAAVADAVFADAQVEFRKLYSAEDNAARFDLTFVADQIGDAVSFKCIYNRELFDPATIDDMLENIVWLASTLSLRPTERVRDLQIVAPQALMRQRALMAGPALPLPDATFMTRFDAAAQRYPDNIAIVEGDVALDYRTLAETANRLARGLAARFGEDARLAVIGDPGVAIVVAALACCKAGLCYVPIASDTPQERIRMVLEQSGCDAVLAFSDRFAGSERMPVLRIAELEALAAEMSPAPLPAVDPDRLAYILFTSGTTGRPKGIPVAHRGIVNLFESHRHTHGLEAGDRVLFQTAFSFDASLLEAFWPLCYGAATHAVPACVARDPGRLRKYVNDHRISVMQTVPALLDAFVEHHENEGLRLPESVRLFIVGGSALSAALAKRCRARFDGVLANHYGPSEVTVDASLAIVDDALLADCAENATVPIGRPIHNAEIRIVDRFGAIVPLGAQGELEVASPGLALGYLDDAPRTEERFPLRASCGGDLRPFYRTGDLVRLRRDGVLHFRGRIDKQVKVAGNRIELEEIEVSISALPQVASAVVRQSAEGGLIAHVELAASSNRLRIGDRDYRLFSLAQRPDMRNALHALHLKSWPRYAEGSATVRTLWSRLYAEYPDYQLLLVCDGALVAAGNCVPLRWNGEDDALPAGWDQMLSDALTRPEEPANTLGVLAGVVDPEHRGLRLSRELLRCFRGFAHAMELERILIPVRPSDKAAHPERDFADWCALRDGEGRLCDRWLRTHEEIGGRIGRIADRSQTYRGTLAEWSRWCGVEIVSDGRQMLPETLAPVDVRFEEGTASYVEPAIWVTHVPTPMPAATGAAATRAGLLDALRVRVPDYMLPGRFVFHEVLPKTESGKIDERSLAAFESSKQVVVVPPADAIQRALAKMWRRALGATAPEVGEIGSNSDFFELGGQSLQLVRLIAQMQKRFATAMEVVDVYRHPTIAELGKLISSRMTPEASAAFVDDDA